MNPGGPGFGGSVLAAFAPQIYDDALLDRFDIVGWDPRGTGLSTPAIDCIDDYDPFFAEIDITPETDEERRELVAVAQEFADRCVRTNEGVTEHAGTNNSARDMDVLRRALGEETISYFGFSYGSELGATWATLFPDTVRAAVLDGAADPNADSLESSLQQLEGFEASLTTFLQRCSSDASCKFHNDGNAEAAFEALMEKLDANPAPTSSGRPPTNLAVAIHGVIEAMYSDSYWPTLEAALAAAGWVMVQVFLRYMTPTTSVNRMEPMEMSLRHFRPLVVLILQNASVSPKKMPLLMSTGRWLLDLCPKELWSVLLHVLPGGVTHG